MKKEKGKKSGGKVIPFKPKPARTAHKNREKIEEQASVNLPSGIQSINRAAKIEESSRDKP